MGAGRYASLAGGDDGRRLPLHFLIEDVLGLRLGQGVPVGYGLDGRGVPRGRPAGRADPRRSAGSPMFRSPDLMESSAIPISFFLIPKGGFGYANTRRCASGWPNLASGQFLGRVRMLLILRHGVRMSESCPWGRARSAEISLW